MKGLAIVFGLIVACLVYLYVPYLFWTWLMPVTFWERVTIALAIAFYEWCTGWIGVVVGLATCGLLA